MIDEARVKANSQKVVQVVELAMTIDVAVLREALPDIEFVAASTDGWVGDMARSAIASTEALLEYREKLDAIVSEMGLDILRGKMPDA